MTRRLKENPDVEKEFQSFLFDEIPKSSNIVFLPNLIELDDEDDKLVSLDKLPGLSYFLEQVPTIDLTPDMAKPIQVDNFEEMLLNMEKGLKEWRMNKDAKERKKGAL